MSKLEHLEHPEDLIFSHGHEGTNIALSALHDTYKKVTDNNHHNTTNVSIKHDGSPSIVFGHDKNNNFFVATKSIFNKTPKVNYSHSDIEKNHGNSPELVSVLKNAYTHLQKITPKNGKVYQGDVMYDENIKKENDTHITFKPNTLTYKIPKNSEEGKKAKRAKFGISVHSVYDNNDINNLSGVKPTGHNEFIKHDDVHVLQHHIDSQINHDQNISNFHAHMQKAIDLHNTHKNYDDSPIKKHSEYLKIYANATVRNGSKPTVDGYKEFLETRKRKEVDSLKKEDAKQRKINYFNDHISDVITHQNLFKNTFTIHQHISNAKNALVHALSKNTPYEYEIDNKSAKPEGFVANTKHGPIKLVDRSEFSRANFLRLREWLEENSFLFEEEEKHHVFAFGRMNPPTKGHELLVNKVKEIAKQKNANHTIVLSHTTDKKKNPLEPNEKLTFARKAFPNTNLVLANKEMPSLIHHVKKLYQDGVTHLTFVAGSDRVQEYKDLLNKYNGSGPGKEFNFKKIDVVSSGARDSDGDHLSSLSASKQREHAKANNMKEFHFGTPDTLSTKDKEALFHSVRRGLGL